MTSARLFTAIMPAPTQREALDELRRSWLAPHIRPRPRAERLHLTLQFAGQCPAALVPQWLQALATLRFAPFEIELVRAERWRDDLLVLCPQPSDALQGLYQATLQLAQNVGVPVDKRAWRPHVTMLRGTPAALPVEVPRPLRWPVREVALVASYPTAQPPRYEALGRFAAST